VFAVLDIFCNNLFEKIGSSLNIHRSKLLSDATQRTGHSFTDFCLSEQLNHAK
jgi:uncharacterized protein (DUF1778 family)